MRARPFCSRRPERLPRLASGVVALGLLWLLPGAPARAQSSACIDHLDRDTYPSGFSASDFSTTSSVDIVSGALVLDTDARKLGDTNRIAVNTRQKLSAHYVYESAGASHTFGYFVWNNAVTQYMSPAGYNYTSTTCGVDSDCDPGTVCRWNGSARVCAYTKYVLKDDGTASGPGVTHIWAHNQAFDWLEGLYDKSCNTCTPYLLQGSRSDGGIYPHVPNLLEALVAAQGQFIFLLCDDDSDTGVYGNLAPVADHSATKNGVPDYDVNGDGVIDDQDRVVDMGTFDAGAELVFFLNVYYGQSPRKTSMGMGASQTCTNQLVCPNHCWPSWRCGWCKSHCGPSQYWQHSYCRHSWTCKYCRPYYKQVCSGTSNGGTIYSRIIPYFSKRVLNPDYKSSGNAWIDRDIGCGYPGWCSGHQGWLDSASLSRLRTLYGLNIPHEVKRIYYRMDGQSDHIFVGAPSTDPNWWILGFEDLYDHGDRDFNDLVFLIFRTNGGETVSNIMTDEMSASQKANSTITKVHFKKRDYIPIPPCSSDPDKVRIEYYVSIGADQGGDPIWVLVEFPPSSPNEVTLDMQELGLSGTDLRWKAVIISDSHTCHPKIYDVNVGYEAMEHGDYLFSSPLLLANALYRGSTETRDRNWTVTGNDYASRGHFRMYEIYEPDTPETEVDRQVWDAGGMLASRNPDTRVIWTSHGGTKESLTVGASSWALSQVLSASDRLEKLNGVPVFDMDGDNDADDNDARYFVQWTRGWETPTSVQRAWKLGAINHSTGAVVHVPGEPDWLAKVGVPTTIRTAYTSWSQSTAIAERRSVAYVGAQDGMLHAFDAGDYRWGDNPATSAVEQRGYFKYKSSKPDYGTGSELWAFVPPSLLGSLKFNRLRTYYPETNPPAMVDGAVVVSDIYGKFHSSPSQKKWRTGIFFTMGTVHPYVSALDVTDPGNPAPLWTTDWTDADFHGTSAPPSVDWIPGSSEPSWAMTVSSGFSPTTSDVYLYVVDVATGNTVRKVRLNQGSGVRGAKAFGVHGRPVMVDLDDDGVSDRVYVADTNGRVWRHNLDGSATNVCLVASVGQGIYHTPAFMVSQNSAGKSVVSFYFATADRPDQDDTPNPPYYVYAMVDEDQTATSCHLASLLYKKALPTDEKVWADPAISADRLYIGSATGGKANLCDEDPSNPGHLYTFTLDPASPGLPGEPDAPVSAGGNVVSGIMVYDQHVVVNTVGGSTTLLGGSTWNNVSGLTGSTTMTDSYWNEVINH